MKRIIFSLLILCVGMCLLANTTPQQCQGSLRPYPHVAQQEAAPDSLTPVMMVHVGRHGSRFPAGSYSANTMLKTLNKADSLHTLTPLGMNFKRLIENIIVRSIGRWGELDSIGINEQRKIARRTFSRCAPLFSHANVVAIASHSPRAVMSMYAFAHEISRLAKGISISASSGKQFDPLVRPFDCNPDYKAYMKEKPYMSIYRQYVSQNAPTPVSRLLGEKFPATKEELQELSIIEYYNIANLSAMGMDHEWQPYLSETEYEQLWSCFNLRQYFMHCSNHLSAAPAHQAKPLLADIISHLSQFEEGEQKANVFAYFAHQETIMPLMSLLKIEGTEFKGKNWKQLKNHVQDHHICPMAANLQFTIYKSHTGALYLRCDLNEKMLPIKNDNRNYLPLHEAILHLSSLLK
ncbi:MAG: histidine phosphatase family protein [Sodaliphilus sp.]